MDSNRRREVERIRQSLVRGIASAKAGEEDAARYYLGMVIDRRGEPDQLIEAYYYLSLIESDIPKKRELLENILAIQPSDARARRELAVFDGLLPREEIINPDQATESNVISQPFLPAFKHECPQCGGALHFDPASRSRTCQHCGFQEENTVDEMVPSEQSFVAGAATRRGHASPDVAQLFQCPACGTEYLYDGARYGLVCAHCDSAFSSVVPFTRDLIAPTGTYLPRISLQDSEDLIRDWAKSHNLSTAGALEKPAGIFLPAWTFDFGGIAYWSAEVYKDQEWGPIAGSKLVDANDYMVPASPHTGELLGKGLDAMQMHQAVSYSPQVTAGWLAESYTIAMVDAAVGARGNIVSLVRIGIEREIFGTFRRLSIQTREIIVESYKLVLVPAWHSHYAIKGQRFAVSVNAVTGHVQGKLPPTRWERLIHRLRGT